MKDPLLLLLVILVGAFVYFVTFKGVIYPIMLLGMIVVVVLWYLANQYISEKMVKKSRNGEEFFFQKAQMINEKGDEKISGALAITKDEIIFYKRKGYWGGVTVLWSAFTSTVLSYALDYVDDRNKGIAFTLKGVKEKKLFISPKLEAREEELKKALNWD